MHPVTRVVPSVAAGTTPTSDFVSHGPVVDALSAHTELFSNHLGLDPAPEHQQTRRSRARVPMFVIDRQLLQRRFLGFAQFYNTLHPLPRHHDGARIAKFKSIDQEHLIQPGETRDDGRSDNQAENI